MTRFKPASKLPYWLLALGLVFLSYHATSAQKLEVTGQKTLSVDAGKSITLQLSDFTIKGSGDDQYPTGFELEVYDGDNYTVSGTTVTPDAGFKGTLKVIIKILRVKDGDTKAESDLTEINVEVKAAAAPPPAVEKLTITGQKSLSTTVNTAITLKLSDFTIDGPGESEYPTDFILEVFGGSNYSIAGTTVTPSAGFIGTLTVEIKITRIKDGKVVAESDKKGIKIEVKEATPPPAVERLTITGQKTLSTTVNTAIALKLSDFTIDGPGEGEYPTNFSLEVFGGSNYSIAGTTVTPSAGFKGTLTVEIKITRMKDGKVVAESDKKGIKIEVVESAPPPATNTPPQIIGQQAIRISVNQSVKIGFEHLTVVDPDNAYPTGFSIKLSSGPNFTIVTGNTVVPDNGYTGTLVVKTVVNDGKADSQPFDLKILVVEENTTEPPPASGAPVFVTFSESQLNYSLGNTQFFVAREIEIDDPDSEELFYAEVYFDAEGFVAGKDLLTVETSGNLTDVFDPDRGILVIFGKESLALYQETLRSLKYNFASDSLPLVKQKRIHFRLNDGENSSEIKTKSITLNETVSLDIPNVFSPNDDNANDLWQIRPSRTVDKLNTTIRVFDKRGVLIFETNDLSNYWDGRSNGQAVPGGPYYYTIDVASGVYRIRHQGTVTILR